MTRLGAIDWGKGQYSFQYKLGYCPCGDKILATPDELREIIEAFGFLTAREPGTIRKMISGLLRGLLTKLS